MMRNNMLRFFAVMMAATGTFGLNTTQAGNSTVVQSTTQPPQQQAVVSTTTLSPAETAALKAAANQAMVDDNLATKCPDGNPWTGGCCPDSGLCPECCVSREKSGSDCTCGTCGKGSPLTEEQKTDLQAGGVAALENDPPSKKDPPSEFVTTKFATAWRTEERFVTGASRKKIRTCDYGPYNRADDEGLLVCGLFASRESQKNFPRENGEEAGCEVEANGVVGDAARAAAPGTIIMTTVVSAILAVISLF